MYVFSSLLLFPISIVALLTERRGRIDLPLVFYGYWFVFLIFGVTYYYPLYPVSPLTIIWIYFVCFSFHLGYKCGTKVSIKGELYNPVFQLVDRKDSLSGYILMKVSVFLFWGLFFIFIYKISVVIFVARRVLPNTYSLIGVFSAFREIKYGASSITSRILILNKPIELLYYSFLIIIGRIWMQLRKRERFVLLTAFCFDLLLMTITDGAKVIIIFSVTLFSVGYLISAFKTTTLQITDLKLIKLLPIVFFVFYILFFFIGKNIEKLIVYAFGEIPAFDYFFKSFNNSLSYGKQTFFGFVRFINPNELLSEGEVNYTLVDIPGLRTNVYTAFRCLIADFGYYGALLFILCAGFFAGLACKRKKSTVFSDGVLGLIIGYIFMSFLISIGYYLTIVLSFFLAPFLLLCMMIIIRKPQHHGINAYCICYEK